MTVAQLKALLAAVPDDAVVLTHLEYARYKDAKLSIRNIDGPASTDHSYYLSTSPDKQAVIFT